VLSPEERHALYALPDFDDFQRAEYFAFTPAERAAAEQRRGHAARIVFMLQLGYFKAKRAFFDLSTDAIPLGDVVWLTGHYFPGAAAEPGPVTAYERYAQRREIIRLAEYRLWAGTDHRAAMTAAAGFARRDVTPSFVLMELLGWLNARRIVRPGYTTLQTIIADALTKERERLETIVMNRLADDEAAVLGGLLTRDDTLSGLSILRHDARNFGYRMMAVEREKHALLAPVHRAAGRLMPSFAVSRQNIEYYASLVHYYTVFDLRRMRPGQAYLYLLCYGWLRHRQLTDNILDAFTHHLRRIHEEAKAAADTARFEALKKQHLEAPRIGRVLLLYADDGIGDGTPFGAVRGTAFAILPREALLAAGQRLSDRSPGELDLRWRAFDRASGRFRQNARPLAMALAFSAKPSAARWLAALNWMRTVFRIGGRLAHRPAHEIPVGTIPARLRPHLLEPGGPGQPERPRGDRYEFWVYRQIVKRLASGDIAADTSLRHLRFDDELVSAERAVAVLRGLEIPFTARPLKAQVDALCGELDRRWLLLARDLRHNRLKHVRFDPKEGTLTSRKPRPVHEEGDSREGFYASLPQRGIADVFHFVNRHCGFLAALTPLQPRHARKIAGEDSLTAAILARAIGRGDGGMAETCDIPYHVLSETARQHIRLATLRESCDRISDFIAALPIFPLYSFDPGLVFGAVDGQKFASAEPTIKARHSRKYFGRGRGVVAYTLLANHVPLNAELIGANEHESHYVFDICYNNGSDIVPDTITGDMHSVNKANFAILNWFGPRFAPRFTSLQAQLPHLYAASEPPRDCPLKPTGLINRQLVTAEVENLERIVATLSLKEMTQSILVRKLCALPQGNSLRKAVFEFDRLARAIYTIDYIRDHQLQADVHRSQNRIESYHQLRAAIARAGGAKQLAGGTDLDVAIANQCGRLTASVIIAYNSMLLSALLARYRGDGDGQPPARLIRISPVAWRHVHFMGRYLFRGPRQPIDPDTILAGVTL
jgi:TnpA family transposase